MECDKIKELVKSFIHIDFSCAVLFSHFVAQADLEFIL